MGLTRRYGPRTDDLPPTGRRPCSPTRQTCNLDGGARLHLPPGVGGVAENTHAAPTPPPSSRPPKMAVSPPADRATAEPCPANPTAPAPTSLLPSKYQAPDLRM